MDEWILILNSACYIDPDTSFYEILIVVGGWFIFGEKQVGEISKSEIFFYLKESSMVAQLNGGYYRIQSIEKIQKCWVLIQL